MTYFSFSLEEFAREILGLIDVLNDLKQYTKSSPPREWNWFAFWSAKRIPPTIIPLADF